MRQFSAKQNPAAKTDAPHLASSRTVKPERLPAPGQDPSRTAAPPSGFDFGRIAVHARTPIRIQPKLTVGTAGGALEQEADRVAEQVMRAPQPVRSAQAGPSENRIAPAPQLQTKSADAGGSGGIAAPPIVHDVLRSSGQPLDAATRAFMEPRFRHDFSKVRVHADARAAESARAVNALAYTVGPNIVFGAGRYTPATPDGSRLIAHELTHVRQQQNYSQLSGLESPHLQRAIESESEEAALQEEEAEGGADQEEFLSEEMMGSVANGPFGPWPWMRKKPRSHRKNFQGGGLISALGGTKAVYTHHRHLDFFRRRRPPCNAVTLNIGFQWVSVQPVPTNQAVMNANIARIVRNWQPCNRSIQIVINTPASSNPPPPAWFVAVMNARAALIQQALILGGIPAGAFLPPVINYNQPGTQNAQVLIR